MTMNFKFKIVAILFCFGFLFLVFYKPIFATITNNNSTGSYTDDFSDSSGITLKSNADVDATAGMLKLTNSGGTFTAPFNASGTATLSDINPLSVAKWGTLSIVANTPTGTSIKVQVYDDSDTLYADSYLPGNSTGISVFPVDMSSVPVLQCAKAKEGCTKPQKLRFKFTLTTSNTSVTPSIDSLSFTWTVKQGDLSSSTLSTGAWAMDGLNQKGTRNSPYNNSQIYPAVRWVSNQYAGENMIDRLYVSNGQLFGWHSVNAGKMFAMNKTNGSELWNLPYDRGSEPGGFITQNGTFYGTEAGDDLSYAVDSVNGQIKWGYDFYNGHGNSQMLLGNNGTIFTVRNNSGFVDTIYNFNQDGTLNWTYDITTTGTGGNKDVPCYMSMATDGTLYYGTQVMSGYSYLNSGELRAINPANGHEIWTYPTGDLATNIAPIIDSDGTIYVGNYSYGNQIKLYAINPNGTKKWEKSFGTGYVGFSSLALGSNGKLWATLWNSDFGSSTIAQISTSDGTILWSSPISSASLVTKIFSDSSNGAYFAENDTASFSQISYYDASHNLKWKIPYSYSGVSGSNTFFNWFTDPVIDENGWLYSGLSKAVNDSGYNPVTSQQYAEVFAMAPWTLSVNNGSGLRYHHGDTVNFSITTSMLQTNLLLGGNNQMQIITDNGDKITMSYSSTNSNGDTVWTGTYALPSNITDGPHVYTAEASQANIQTDITTHFASAPTLSNNTGITSTFTITIIPNYTLTYSSGANGTVSGSSPQTVAQGTSGSAITATPNNCYSFNSWSDGSTQNPRIDTNVTQNISVTANFINSCVGGGNLMMLNLLQVQKSIVPTATPVTLQQTLLFTQPLHYSSRGEQVVLLQNELKKLGFISQSITPNGNFGPITLKAVQAFQIKYNIAKSGATGYGNVGPMTRKILNSLE